MADDTATYENLGNRIIRINHGRTTPNPYEFTVGTIVLLRDGDTIEVRDPEYMLKKGEAKVVSSELIDPYHIKVVLDRNAEDFTVGRVIENYSANPDVYIAGCHSSRVTTKGFLTGTRGKVLIE